MGEYLISVDTGGTFTDCVVVDEKGGVIIAKAPSTPHDFSIGVLDSVKVAAEMINISMEELLKNARLFLHGTTVATNAAIVRSGAKVGLITTKGFQDTIFIMRGRGRTDGLLEMEIRHETTTQKPKHLLPRWRVVGVTERVDCFGEVLAPLNTDEVREAAGYLVDEQGVEAIAVCLLWSFRNPSHEIEIKKIIEEMYPHIWVSISTDLAPSHREYPRSNTAVIDSYVGPLTSKYLAHMEKTLKDRGYEHPLMIMQSYGGVLEAKYVHPVFTAVSGPAGGVVGSRYWADLMGIENIITTDVGGTSFDVSIVPARERLFAREPLIGRFVVLIPMIDILTVGAGGGTTAWIDQTTQLLKVGPRSAGADPGPVCYQKGGSEPTVTDADVVLGYIDPEYCLGGRMKIDREAAICSMEQMGKQLGMDHVETAAAIYDIQNEHMADLIRSAMIEKGYDPRDFTLFAFGGGGPTHAATYGPENRVKNVVMFPISAVFSAYGIVTSDVINSYELARHFRLPGDSEEINRVFEDMEKTIIRRVVEQGFREEQIILQRSLKMRYGIQVHEVRIPAPPGSYDPDKIKEISNLFEKKYEDIYGKGTGYREAGIDIVSFEVEGIVRLPNPKMKKYELSGTDSGHALRCKRPVYFKDPDGFVDTKVYYGDKLKAGNVVEGPTVIEYPTTTAVILPNQVAKVDEYLNLII